MSSPEPSPGKKSRKVFSEEDYARIIGAYVNGEDVGIVAESIGVGKRGAARIVKAYVQTGKTAPGKRGRKPRSEETSGFPSQSSKKIKVDNRQDSELNKQQNSELNKRTSISPRTSGSGGTGSGNEWIVRLTHLVNERYCDNLERHYVTLATVGSDGTPSNRTVNCRKLLPHPQGYLIFFSDTRSKKVADLRQNNRAEVCWYFPEEKLQFRIAGQVEICEDLGFVVEQSWLALSNREKKWWLGSVPGKPLEKAVAIPDHEIPEAPPASFCLLILRPQKVDLVSLDSHPFTREIYTRSSPHAGSEWTSIRVNP